MTKLPQSEGPQERFGRLLGLVARLWRTEIDRRLAASGLTESRWLALLHLSRLPGPITQRELAHAMGLRDSTLVPTLDWLEAEGLIERRTASADRRSKAVQVSAQAAPIVADIEAATAQVRARILSGIPAADLAACLRVLERLAGRLGPGPSSGGGGESAGEG